MYVCVCHGLTDRDVRCSATECNGTIGDLYRALGVRPTCGKCVPFVREAIRAAPPSPALTYPAATA